MFMILYLKCNIPRRLMLWRR